MKIVAFVPIKLKSQRLPNKMLLPLGDKLLCQHIFRTLLLVKQVIDVDIYCYCSDEQIKHYLPNDVIFLKRSVELDRDETKGMEIYKCFSSEIKADIYGLFHATSPFIDKSSIIEGFNKILYEQYDSSFSCSKIQTFSWYKNTPLNYSLNNIVKTQDIEPIYWETSAFYLFKKSVLETNKRIGTNPYMIVTNRVESVDIDEKDDYEIAKAIIHTVK